MVNLYASLADLRLETGVPDSTDDVRLLAKLRDASRAIDAYAKRRFYVETRTRTFEAHAGNCLILADDLLSITTLKTDVSGDRTYTETWATTDYDLCPENALYESPPEPYWEIRRSPNGDYSFPSGLARGVQIVGSWGYYEVLERSTATLSAAITTTTATTCTVSDGTQFGVGQTLKLGTEQVYVSAISTNTLTLTRSVNGTTAATHLNAAVIDVYTYPEVHTACLMLAARLWALKDAPLGVTGSMEFGTVRVGPSFAATLRDMLALARRRTAA